MDIGRRGAEMTTPRLFLTGPRDSLGLFRPLGTGSQGFYHRPDRFRARGGPQLAGSGVASRSSQTGLRNPQPTSGFRTALPELRRRYPGSRAAYGRPSGANYWFPGFCAGREAFGGALVGHLGGERAEGE